MSISDLSKLILFLAISVSCVGISIQLMRLLSAITDNVKDLRKTVKNIGILSAGLVEDQKLLKRGIESIARVVKKVEGVVDLVSTKVIRPITVIGGFFSSISKILDSLGKKYTKK